MKTQFIYLPQDKATRSWGLYVCDAGWQRTSPHEEYSRRQHPDGYCYTWETGRRLSEYQLFYVVSGGGVVEFEPGRPRTLAGGTLLLLTPGEWHRCRPDGETGMGTLWIGFNGKMAHSIVQSAFHSGGRIMRKVDKANDFEAAAMRLVNQMVKSGERRPLSSAGDLISLLGRISEGEYDNQTTPTTTDAIRQAQAAIARRATETIDFGELARAAGMTYDRFRHHFVDTTGLPPLKFQLAERLRMAKNLVSNTDLPMAEIARRTGFSSSAYFTRFFKAATKMSPTRYRGPGRV